jgi:hypothetical protein
MSRRAVALTVAALTLVVAPTVALGGAAANSQTFTDSTGEDPAAPDIQSIAVSNDDAGLISFQLSTPNRPALNADMLFLIFIDTIPNAGDPDSLGADWALQLVPEGVALFKWDGQDYPFVSSQSVGYTYGPTGPTLRVSAVDLGKPKTLNFVALAISGIAVDASGDADFTNAHADIAPDAGRGVYAYEVKTTLVLTVVKATMSPKVARSGAAFSATFAATRNDTGGPVPEGTVTCRAKIAGRPVAAKSRRVSNGVAACVWSIPASAKGKRITGTISLTVEGATVTRPFSSRIV